MRAGRITGQLISGTFRQTEKRAHSYQYRDARASQETHTLTRAALKHGVEVCRTGELTQKQRRGRLHGLVRPAKRLTRPRSRSPQIFVPGVKASIRFLPLARRIHTHR